MYRPAAFDQTDLTTLAAAINEHSFGLVIADGPGDLEASHLPLLLDLERGERGCLTGHVARANPLWQRADGRRVLTVFSGPHAYISPTWYGEPNTVPTWNYVAVHVYGLFRAVHDPDEILQIVQRMVAVYEAGRQPPWTFDSSDEGMRKMARVIVGFSIEVDRVEGKWKLGQNRSGASRARVANILSQSADPNDVRIGELMRE